MERLKDDADFVAAEAGERVLVERREVLAGHRDLALSGRSSPAVIIIIVDLPDQRPTRPTVSPRPI